MKTNYPKTETKRTPEMFTSNIHQTMDNAQHNVHQMSLKFLCL